MPASQAFQFADQKNGSASAIDTEVFPHFPDGIPPGIEEAGRIRLRFAWTRADLIAVQKLRYQVFNEELGEGLASSSITGRDEDDRDPSFHHLMIEDRDTRNVVGTYRLQTAVMAATRYGFYGATLFELATLPPAILADSIEIGRACVAKSHRNGRVLRMLWKGLARYMAWNSKRYLFGCCSIPGTDLSTARDVWGLLHSRGALHDTILARPRTHTRALPDDGRSSYPSSEGPNLPPLFESYLSLGARVCGPPAVDHEFGTTDCLVLLDVNSMHPRTYSSLFG